MMKKIYITRDIPSVAKEMLQKKFEVTVNKNTSLSKEELIKIVEEYDGMLSTTADKLSEEVLSHAKNLKVIANYAIGLDNIDLRYAKSKKIAVFNLPDIVTNSSADLTFALLLSFVRRICPSSHFVKEGKWKFWKPDLFLGEELIGKNFAIIGMGRIGQAVARRAQGFGMNVIYYNRTKKELPKDLTDCVEVSLEEIYKIADYISLHVALTSETKHLINESAFKKMKKKPLLINMARGDIINSDDLVRALNEGLIRGAALDVTSPEPLSGDHPLCKIDNCLITPHIGTSTIECRYAMAKKAAEIILDYF